MLKSYFLISIRNLRRNLGHTTIGVAGLILGIAGAVNTYLITDYLMSYDDFHGHAENIYRVVFEMRTNNTTEYRAGVPLPFLEAFRTDFPEAEKVALVSYKRSGLVSLTDAAGERKTFDESSGIAYVTPEFYEIFDRTWLAGNKATALKDPNTAVLSERSARKYFGTTDVLGKSLRLDDDHDLKITFHVEDEDQRDRYQESTGGYRPGHHEDIFMGVLQAGVGCLYDCGTSGVLGIGQVPSAIRLPYRRGVEGLYYGDYCHVAHSFHYCRIQGFKICNG